MQFITINNIKKEKLIEGVLLRPLIIHSDESGILVETLRKDWKPMYKKGREFAMQYYSVTNQNIARDEDVWHYHPGGQEDRFLVVSGTIVVAIADNRPKSKTKGLLNLFLMDSKKESYLILIPPQTLHGFMVVSSEPATLLNFPTRLYDPKEELRIPYEEAQVKLSNGKLFGWDLVRKEFSRLNKTK